MQAGILFPNISPEIFSITLFGMVFALRWYALSYIVGIVIGWKLATHALRRPALWPHDKPAMTPAQLEDLLTWIVIGIILGGRLGYVLIYQPSYYLQNPGQILHLWEGGMAFHGGLTGVILAVFIYCRRQALPLWPTADLMALGTPPALFLVRIANFINAELWGRVTDLPWAVIFPGAAAQDCGQPLGDLCARHPSQIYEALLEGALLTGVLVWLAYRRGALKRPGLVFGTFFAGYGLSRFLVEFVRQPDAQFISPGNPLGLALHLDGYGLTMGQILSLPMIVIGAYAIWRSRSARA